MESVPLSLFLYDHDVSTFSPQSCEKHTYIIPRQGSIFLLIACCCCVPGISFDIVVLSLLYILKHRRWWRCVRNIFFGVCCCCCCLIEDTWYYDRYTDVCCSTRITSTKYEVQNNTEYFLPPVPCTWHVRTYARILYPPLCLGTTYYIIT